ncbi:MAG: peroxide stress protein YaaA [Castellaniella sp.]|uniref:peroxide stress protein YaaA n=1 Tax=Castellaniella sp. TaxID=1955812 RepID=UPI00121BFA31|nr:peroxide stress protein YaaA [Castellaniella sp.]TAN26026.1 MAG: peroxide stress protein YaaA [Castellaniella sp.]
MLMVLSPAKKLDYDTPVRTTLQTHPVFSGEALELVRIMQRQTPVRLARLMDLSDALARLNADRYASWVDEPDARQGRQAALAFNGDVYEGLRASELSDARLSWAQDHLAILSGLYGVLRPLDLIQPHRLEMGTALHTKRGRTLYAYWGGRIAQELNRRLDHAGGDRVLLNLASNEYFKSVDLKALQARVVDCVFQDEKNGAWKVISFYAKRARGLMARFVIDHRITSAEGLRKFDSDGYRYMADASTPDRLVFRRAHS